MIPMSGARCTIRLQSRRCGDYGGGGRKGPCAGGRDGVFPARCASRSRSFATHKARRVPAGRLAQRDLPARNKEFPAEYGSGSNAHLHGRRAGTVGAPGDAFAGGHHLARASFVCATAAAGLQAAGVRSARELLRHPVHGLRDADQRADCEEVYGAAPAGEKDPTAAMSDPVQPLVYYLDRGAPEPIRSALLEGARWWNQAFEATGYKDAFRVELLP